MKILPLFKPVIFGLLMVCLFSSNGQGQMSADNLPIGAMPMQFNSSFAGETGGARFNTAFTYNLENPYEGRNFGLNASYDQYIPAIRSGVGISMTRGIYSFSPPYLSYSYKYNHNKVALAIAPKVSIKGKYTLSPSIDFLFGIGNLKSNLPENQVKYFNPNSNMVWYQSRIALLFNTSKYYIGYSVNLLNPAYLTGLGPDINEEYNYVSYIQAGYTFQKNSESKFSFTPQIVYRIQAKNLHFDRIKGAPMAINLIFRYDNYLGGLNHTGFLIGFQTKAIRFMVSNHLIVPNGGPFSIGNISLRYLFNEPVKN